jgi:GDPmannose 4,6-dehydratase
VRVDPTYFRPTEVDLLIGDASKARQKLGWKPKTSFAQLVREMVAGDVWVAISSM